MQRQYVNKFICATVSTNTNSFGLYQFILISRQGEAYKAHASYYNVPKKGDEVFVPIVTDKEGNVIGHNLSALSYEMPIRLERVPQSVINEAFKQIPK